MRWVLAALLVSCTARRLVAPPEALAAGEPHKCGAESVSTGGRLTLREGPREALAQLTRDDGQWFHVLRCVSSGAPAWLEIAAKLHPVADGGPGEELVISIQDALPRATELVLDIVARRTSFTVREVCGNYGTGQIEDERPKSVVLDLVHERQRKVRRVKEGRTLDVRNACLAELANLEARVGRWAQ